jgi:hypothetical protein
MSNYWKICHHQEARRGRLQNSFLRRRAMTYEKRFKDGGIIPCNSCGCEVATATFPWMPMKRGQQQHDTEKRFLCKFCALSGVGGITGIYGYESDTSYLRRQFAILVAEAVNFLVDELREGVEKP